MTSEQEYGAEVLRVMRFRYFIAVFPAMALAVPPVEATSQQRPWVLLAVTLVVLISAAVGVAWARRVYPRTRARRLAANYEPPAPRPRSGRRMALGGLVTIGGLAISRGNPVVLPLLLAAPMVVIVALAQTTVVLEKRLQRSAS